MFQEFISTYGMEILYAVITAVAGWLAVAVKSLVTKYLDNKTKKDVASTVVKAVEQIYKDLHGEDKLKKAITYMSDMLTSKGIKASEVEILVLLEAAVGEFNKVFESDAQ